MRVSVGSLGVRSLAVIALALACHACGSNAAPPAASSSTPAASATPAATPASTSGSTEFGVPECDDYMKKYLACIDKLAPSAQAQARQALDQSREAWKQAASTEMGKTALASTCKTASDTAAPAMRAQGCTW
jgi:hypothetical protein